MPLQVAEGHLPSPPRGYPEQVFALWSWSCEFWDSGHSLGEIRARGRRIKEATETLFEQILHARHRTLSAARWLATLKTLLRIAAGNCSLLSRLKRRLIHNLLRVAPVALAAAAAAVEDEGDGKPL